MYTGVQSYRLLVVHSVSIFETCKILWKRVDIDGQLDREAG